MPKEGDTPGITSNSDSMNVHTHTVQVREGTVCFKLLDFLIGLLCRIADEDTVHTWLISPELCNDCCEVLLALTVESIDLFQDSYIFFL